MAQADARDVQHGVRRSGRQHADPDPGLAGTRHAVILPEPAAAVV
jgi:hypothetical protein